MAVVHAAAWVVFLVSYAVFAFGRLPGTKVDRPAMAVIGASIAIAIGLLSPANAVKSIDFETIVLLFTMMLIVGGLHLGGFFDFITHAVADRLDPKYLLPAIIFTGGILSAFLVNDVVCVFMAPLVLQLAKRLKLAPIPYLLALATASNIGSTATITGNPQNILIGSVSKIGYIDFMRHLGPIAFIGLFIDWAVLHFMLLRKLPVSFEPQRVRPDAHRPSTLPVLTMLGVLTAFLAGVNPAMAAALGCSALLISRDVSPRKLFAEVDYTLLIFFVGLFLIIGEAQQTGIANEMLDAAKRFNLHRSGIYTVFTVLLSNVVSNVPAVMLLKETIRNFADQHRAWLLLAMASTLAGNLTITGSVANIIVVEKAAPEAHIGFWEYAKVGAPITVLTVLLGWAWLAFVPY